MWLSCKVFFLLFLAYTQGWSYSTPDSLFKIDQLPVDGLLMNTGWKYKAGDDRQWANPQWDDRDWWPINPTKDIHDLPQLWNNETGWLRLRFSLDSTLRRESLALLVEQTGASEIYLNGQLIGKYGRFANGQAVVQAAYPPFGEFISLQPDGRREQVLAVRFAIQKNIPYVNFAGRYSRALALKVMKMNGVTSFIRSNTHYLDYVKASIFFTLALLHLVLFCFSPGRKANLYFFLFSFLTMTDYLVSGFTFEHVTLAATRMYLLILSYLLCSSGFLFFLLAAYTIFKPKRGIIFWLLLAVFLISFPLYLYQYQTGWIWGLMLFPILIFLETARITLLANRKNISGARVVTYGAAAFLTLYTLYFTFHFGLLPMGPNGFWGHVTFNLGVLSLPISLSIYLATEASFTSRSLAAKLVEVQQLSQKTLLQEREKRQMQETNEIKSRFFANISHEFRTPLSLIRGTVEKLRKQDPASDRQADYGAIDRSAGRLLQMINQLLDLSRLESGKLSLHLEPGNLSELLKVLGSSFSSLFESKGIIYRYTVPLQPVWVHLDCEKLEQIINNLLSNAAKFTPANGEVNFLATLETIPDGRCSLQIKVQDTGIGISATHLPHIFDRFYQTDNSLTRQYEGTGIGLALVKELVELHGGKIGVDSSVDKGSTFTVTLLFNPAQDGQVTRDVKSLWSKDALFPLAVEVTAPDRDKMPERNRSRSVHILVVEDNRDLQHFMAQCLSVNYQVREAGNGLEGYKKATELLPDLIISDIMMPGMDGITLCRKLKEDKRTSHIPVILLTAKADAHSKLSGLEVGADDYLTKPFSTEELMHRVSNLIRQRQQLKGKFSRSLTIQPTEVTIGSADEQFLQKVISVVEENMANPDFDVDTFSRELGMSRTQLNRKLTALLEQSPNEFIRTMRLKRAAALLAGQQGNVGEVAFMVGFSNPNYFTKCFRDYYGLAPTEYILSSSTTQ